MMQKFEILAVKNFDIYEKLRNLKKLLTQSLENFDSFSL